MEVRSIVAHGFFGVVDRVQFFVDDLDQKQCFVGDIFVGGGYGGHLFAHETDNSLGQDRHVNHAAADFGVGHVLAGDNGVNAGQSHSLGGVDADDAGVRVRTAKHPAPEHPRQRDVRGVDRLAGDFVRAFSPGYRLSDGGTGGGHISLRWSGV